VQAGGLYSWTIGANDLTLSNNGTLVTGSNLVPSGAAYTAGSYTLTGLTKNSYYYFVLGANDTSVAGVTSPQFFNSGNSTSATLLGSGTSLITSTVYAAAAGNNLISGQLSYPGTSPNTTGVNLVTNANLSIGGVAATAYSGLLGSGTGSITLTLPSWVIGNVYYYTLGPNEQNPAIGSVMGQTLQTGYITPGTSTITLNGLAGTTPTTTVYLTTATTASLLIGGLTVGQTYYWTKNGDDSSISTSTTTLNSSGFFTATTSQATIIGTSGTAVTALIQQVTRTIASSFVASSNTVTLTGQPGLAVTSSVTGNVGFNNASDQICVIPFANSQTGLSTPDGGTMNYWMLITAVTAAGKQLVLGAGALIAVDSGQATGTPSTGNIVPSGAMYSGGGTYSLAVTAGFNYYWKPGANDTGAPGLRVAGTFTAASSAATLTGTPSTPVTATVYAVNTRPFLGTVTLTAGQPSLVVSGLSLSFTPITAWCIIAVPSGGTVIQSPLQPSTLSASGATFYFNVPIPASGYIATYWIY